MKFVSTLLLLVTARGGAQDLCRNEDNALDQCLEVLAGLGDVAKDACEQCVDTAAEFGAYRPTCDDVAAASCPVIVRCEDDALCGQECAAEMMAKLMCELNDERPTGAAQCASLNCTTPSTTSPSGQGLLGGIFYCTDEDRALDTCLEFTAGLNDLQQTACELCVASAAFAGVAQSTCDQAGTVSCAALANCTESFCDSTCSTEMFDYMICELNEERSSSNQCNDISCSGGGSNGGGSNGGGSSAARNTFVLGHGTFLGGTAMVALSIVMANFH